jgi:site-specific recombinase XerD
MNTQMELKPFFQHLEEQRRCSRFTVRAYRSDLEIFMSFLKSQSITRLARVDHQVINRYIEHLHNRANARTGKTGLADASIARRLSAISSLFEYTRATTDPKLRNPVTSISRKWQSNAEPKPVDDLTLELLITGMTNLRDRTLFTLFLTTGLRVSELHQLNRNSIVIEAEETASGQTRICGSGEVVGKGNKRRRFYVNEDTLYLYAKYLETRTDSSPALFISEKKQRLSVRAIQYLLQKWCQKLGAPHINVHRLRHSYATRLANSNISSMVLKDLMGHSSFSTTQRYFKLTDNTISRGYFAAMQYLK